ncbi:MAG: hypothetical protein ACXVX9_02780, partial [Mycobacteriaceae bacterium]
GPLGFVSLPIGFFLVLVGMLLAYLLLIEAGKLMFYATPEPSAPRRVRGTAHRIHRRASRFSSATTT